MALIAKLTKPEEGLLYTSDDVKFKIDNKVVGTGTLYVCQDALSWQAVNMEEGISINWKNIGIHGTSNNPTKCIYFMLDHKLIWRGVYEGKSAMNGANGHNNGAGDGNALVAGAAGIVPMQQQDDCEEDEGNASGDDDGSDEDEHFTDCWLIPEDINTVDIIFQAMTECQALNPDSADSISSQSDCSMDDEEDELAIGPSAGNYDDDGAAVAQGGMRNLNLDDEEFEDAEDGTNN